jgi:hypothetical protein
MKAPLLQLDGELGGEKVAGTPFYLQWLKIFLESKIYRRIYFSLALLSCIAVIALSFRKNVLQNSVAELDHIPGNAILAMYVLFGFWEVATCFVPYYSVCYLTDTILSEDFNFLLDRSLRLNPSSLKYINMLLLMNAFTSGVAVVIYSILIGAEAGVAFTLMCFLPIVICVNICLLQLELLRQLSDEFLLSLQTDNVWSLREEGLPSSLTSDLCRVVKYFNIFSLKRGHYVGILLMYFLLFLCIIISLSYFFRNILFGLIGIIVIADDLFTQLIVFVARTNESGPRFAEALSIYALILTPSPSILGNPETPNRNITCSYKKRIIRVMIVYTQL